jgi:hypothetical protein
VVPLPQALDGDFSEENRNKCHVATSPLIQAVENLSTFANNPEFASIPAQISHEVGVQGGCRVACVGAVGESLFFYRRNDREKRLKSALFLLIQIPSGVWFKDMKGRYL